MDSVETERLLLRPFTPNDGPSLHAVIGNDPDMTWDGTTRTIDRIEETIQGRIKHFEVHGFGVWAVIDKVSGNLVGQTGLQILQGTEEVELVAYTAKKCWGQGIAFESCIAALIYAFTEMKLSRVIAIMRTQNVVAQRVAEKLGFCFDYEGTAYGERAFFYELLKSDFTLKNQFYKIYHGKHGEPRFDFSKSHNTYY